MVFLTSCCSTSGLCCPSHREALRVHRILARASGVAGGKGDGMAADATDQDPWEWWNRFRSICATDKRLGVALRLTANLPSEEHLLRWFGEPVRCLLVPTTLFLTNKKGYPVLSKSHQAVMRQFFKLNCQVLVEGSCHHEHIRHYYQYIDHLYNTQPPENPLGEFARGYEDQLQIPLQPLMDNLESVTYEIFEKDPVKYTEYQNAIYMALTDRKEEFGSSEIVLMVLGASRGPLVRAALNAAEAADQKIKIYAIEKNPNSRSHAAVSERKSLEKIKVTVVSLRHGGSTRPT
uniref:Protein kinase inhibitor n=1 Tax=Ixodes ricinus TaxID=34613 RepID=V5H6U8_IXORI